MAARVASIFSVIFGVAIGLVLYKVGIRGRYSGFAVLAVYLAAMMVLAPNQARKEPWLRLFYAKRPDHLPPGL